MTCEEKEAENDVLKMPNFAARGKTSSIWTELVRKYASLLRISMVSDQFIKLCTLYGVTQGFISFMHGYAYYDAYYHVLF